MNEEDCKRFIADPMVNPRTGRKIRSDAKYGVYKKLEKECNLKTLTHPGNKSMIMLIEKLGEGGFGEVWMGKVVSIGTLPKTKYGDYLGTIVAVKLSKKDPKYLLIEHHAIMALQGTPGIVPVMEPLCSPSSTMPYIVQRFLKTSLSSFYKSAPQSRLPWRLVYFIGLCLLETLEEMHKQGIVHQDIKPDNIMLDGDPSKTCDNIFYIDFGGACNRKENLTKHNPCRMVGTPNYMSIRQHMVGNIPVYRDDLETLCYTLLQVILGRLPWSGSYRNMNRTQMYAEILAYKMEFGREELEKLFPIHAEPLALLLEEGRSTNTSPPNYEKIRGAFKKLLYLSK